MKVIELIEELKTLNPDKIVIISKDSDGSKYSPLLDIWEGIYKKECTWSGKIQLEENNKNCKGEPAVILTPIY